jgi:hypothetical protein
MKPDADKGMHLDAHEDIGRPNRAPGNLSVSSGLVNQISILGAQGKQGDHAASNFALCGVHAIRPQDAAERALYKLGRTYAVSVRPHCSDAS